MLRDYRVLASDLPTRRCRLQFSICILAAAAMISIGLETGARAQQSPSSGNFLDDLFGRGEPSRERQAPSQAVQTGRIAQADPGELAVRLDRMENALRQLTGTIEQLQYRNQQLEMQLKRMQDEQVGAKPASPSAPQSNPIVPGTAPPSARRSDVFDPAQHPNAPGAPRSLGNQAVLAPEAEHSAPIGAPGGRAAGAPLDLSTLAGNSQAMPAPPQGSVASTGGLPASQQPGSSISPQARNPAPAPAPARGPQLATLPPSSSPQDEYDMAYGYVLHKDYSLAEQAFRDFLKKHPNEHLVADANYWLGESLFQQQRYRDAAEAFLNVSTKYDRASKAPDALLRLGQSLAAMNQKEAACATLAEVGRKYPRASAGVKRGVALEQKRVHC